MKRFGILILKIGTPTLRGKFENNRHKHLSFKCDHVRYSKNLGFIIIVFGLLIMFSSYFTYDYQMGLEGKIEYLGGGEFVRYSTDYFVVSITILGMMIGGGMLIIGSFMVIYAKVRPMEPCNDFIESDDYTIRSKEDLRFRFRLNAEKPTNGIESSTLSEKHAITGEVKVKRISGIPIGNCPNCKRIILKGWERCMHCGWNVKIKELI